MSRNWEGNELPSRQSTGGCRNEDGFPQPSTAAALPQTSSEPKGPFYPYHFVMELKDHIKDLELTLTIQESAHQDDLLEIQSLKDSIREIYRMRAKTLLLLTFATAQINNQRLR